MKKIIFTLALISIYNLISAQITSIFGMAVKPSASQTFLGQINTTSGVVSNISPVSLGLNYVGSLATIDPKNNIYYYENGTGDFIGVDITTGNISTNPVMTFTGASFFDLVAYNCMDSTIYGLARATGPTALFLAWINPGTGVVTKISASSIGNGSLLTPSTIDPVNKKFYFEDGSFLFTGVDLVTGTITSSPAITYPNTNANLFDSYVYNCADSTIYGLARKNSPAQMYLSKINPVTGQVTYISSSNINSNGQTSGGATIDPVNKIFYFQDGNQTLLGVSLITGNIVTSAAVTNTNANSFTNFRSNTLCSCGISTSVKNESINAGAKVFPNPFSNSIHITLHGTADVVNARLLNVSGQVIAERTYTSVHSFSFETGDIAAGIYFLEIDQNETTSRIKVIKD
jgi:hypothetical protein